MSFLFRGELTDIKGTAEGYLLEDLVTGETYITIGIGHNRIFESEFIAPKLSYQVKPETVQIKFGDKWLSYAEFEQLSYVSFSREDENIQLRKDIQSQNRTLSEIENYIKTPNATSIRMIQMIFTQLRGDK